MPTAVPVPAPARSAYRRRVALLVLAVGQLVSSGVVQLVGSEFQTSDRAGEPPIVPPGGAFAIWSLVIALCVAYAIWALPERRPDLELRNRLTTPLLVVFAGFSAWLILVGIEPTWSTLVVFLMMVAGLVWALGIAVENRERIARWGRVGQGLLWGALGVYAGWSSIAVWINLTTAFAGGGAPVTGPIGVTAQLAVLAGATATAAALVRFTGGLLPCATAVAWALGGAALGAGSAGEALLAAAALAGLAAVAGTFVVSRTTRRMGS